MAWGASKKGIADVLDKLERDDAANDVVYIMRTRKITAAEGTRLGKVLARNTTLTELYASGHRLDASAANAIADALKTNRTLRKLCVGDYSFGDSGVSALAEGLATNQGLLVLDLEYKSVGVGGAIALSNMMRLETNVLQELLLSRNALNDEAVIKLSDGVQRLRVLDLSENAFGASGAAALVTTHSNWRLLFDLKW